ncbi:hypothetical protein CKA32_005229 [Geitlerinema sp. FC II]|nr:hypothetical protein CKA32_005229 [Geitlerinema sp. FC II]
MAIASQAFHDRILARDRTIARCERIPLGYRDRATLTTWQLPVNRTHSQTDGR